MKTYPVTIEGYRRLGENGCSLTVHSTLEVNSDDIKFFDEHRGCQALLAITDTTVGNEMPDIDIDKIKASMVENKVYDKDVSPSERMRRDIWVLLSKEKGQDPTKEEFEEYYLDYMNRLHSKMVEKIGTFDE